jgi:hypothetical protein
MLTYNGSIMTKRVCPMYRTNGAVPLPTNTFFNNLITVPVLIGSTFCKSQKVDKDVMRFSYFHSGRDG